MRRVTTFVCSSLRKSLSILILIGKWNNNNIITANGRKGKLLKQCWKDATCLEKSMCEEKINYYWRRPPFKLPVCTCVLDKE
jgi:hypothetical protein